jgi:hypothetical protein
VLVSAGRNQLTADDSDNRIFAVSSVAEIEAILPNLTNQDLERLERALHQQYRARHSSIIYDDDYGVVTEADLMLAADEAFQVYDKEEKDAKGQTR